jgi:hypothetical protein
MMLNVISAFVVNAPSFAEARKTYKPDALNVATTVALPSTTGIPDVFSNLAFAGPRICIQLTVSPRERGAALEFA